MAVDPTDDMDLREYHVHQGGEDMTPENPLSEPSFNIDDMEQAIAYARKEWEAEVEHIVEQAVAAAEAAENEACAKVCDEDAEQLKDVDDAQAAHHEHNAAIIRSRMTQPRAAALEKVWQEAVKTERERCSRICETQSSLMQRILDDGKTKGNAIIKSLLAAYESVGYLIRSGHPWEAPMGKPTPDAEAGNGEAEKSAPSAEPSAPVAAAAQEASERSKMQGLGNDDEVLSW